MEDNQTPQANEGRETNVYRAFGVSPPPYSAPEEDPSPLESTGYTPPIEEPMLVFVHADGMLTAKAYHSLDGVLCPPPYRVLWLLYLNGAYVLEGERLDLLFTKIARHRQGRIHCVDPSFHPDPKQGWAVYSIEQRSPSDMVAELEE